MNTGPCADFLFRSGLRRHTGERMCVRERGRQKERRQPRKAERERERERVTEGRNMALAQLCGTFDMSFEPSLIT